LLVFGNVEETTRLWIKGTSFSISTLLTDDDIATQYRNGSVVICRLSPSDYHRFHSPVSGVVGPSFGVGHDLYSVKPEAIQSRVQVLLNNKRVILPIRSTAFGLVTLVIVGATDTGSINLTVAQDQKVNKGDELGLFAFGGSTVVVLFQENAIHYDQDLIDHSAQVLETLVTVGSSLGRKRIK